EAERAVVEALREGGRVTVSELQARLGLSDLDATLADLEAAGRIAGEDSRTHPTRPGRSARYVAAVELAPHLTDPGPQAARGPAAGARPAADRAAGGPAASDPAAGSAAASAPASGDPAAARRAAAGRSAQALAVIEYLAAIGRPATVAEVLAAAGCGT